MSVRAMSYRVRPAVAADVPLLGPLERAAAARFAAIGLGRIAQGRPTSEAEYRAAIAGGHLWMVQEEGGPVVGLAIADTLDGEGFVAEISVHPDHAGHRLAARMIDAVEAWVAGLGCRQIALTTFRDVPWNRPYYERLGFVMVNESAVGPQLRAVRDRERARGVDSHGARVCMVRKVGPRERKRDA